MNSRPHPSVVRSLIGCGLTLVSLFLPAVLARGDDEAVLFTPPGFPQPGKPATATGSESGKVAITVIDAETGKPTPCRVNVVGPDGNFYQPPEDRLSLYSLTGEWPESGKGNRAGKAPIRYFGRFFYTTGAVTVPVPQGKVRVEVWKGLEYLPRTATVDVGAGATATVEVKLRRADGLAGFDHDSGDPHLHLKRETEADDGLIFDLLEAEDVRFGTPLMYNEPAGPYTGVRAKLDYPQLRGLGAGSLRSRGAYHILSGQEYRTGTYGHLNLFLRDDLVREGESYNADNWPPYGAVGRETQQKGGIAIYAHGGYAQSIYADFVRGDVNAVELLQFGVYRGIELDDWYHILNIGYRFPIVGASDYPACRKLADCVTYVRREPGKAQDFTGWLRGAVEGRGFVTTGPILLLEVEGQGPGAALTRTGPGPQTVAFRARAFSAVTPFSELQIVVNGRVVQKLAPPGGMKQEAWYDLTGTIPLEGSSWVAARAFGKTADGSPDAESHTNPVYVHVDGKAPYDRGSLDHLVGKLDGLMAKTRARSFPEKAKVLDRFQGSRDLLLKVRAADGLPASGLPPDWVAEVDQARFDPSAREHTDAELAAFLKPVPPRTPIEGAEAVESAGGFRLTPVAAEPLVRSPVAAAFDEDGSLYVAEMSDYPYKPRPGGTPLGSIRLLRDTDGDGTFDKADVFADGLLWAAGVLPWKGGVFVTAPPDIWYMKDTDGDHKADVRRKVFTGFGVGNEQGMLNNLTFGLDHKVYGSTSVNGGSVRHADRPVAAAMSVDGKDFRFDPVTEIFEPISGTVQFGTTFDDWGDRFLCSESQPLLHAVLPLDALARNPYLPVASALKSVAGSPVPIQRISPPERWRQIRSSRRIAHGERSADSAGASHHVVDAAAGVTIYRGSSYPAGYYGDAFVCDAQNNLIHRMKLLPDGPTFRAERADPKGEFVRSYDTWFRPVNLINAPDGTLYVLDMSREVIEAIHIPNDVVKHLDLRRGRDQGRIYRIAPPAFTPKAPPRLGTAATTELVAALGHPDGWWRDTAHRLIFERQDAAAVGPLRALLHDGPRPVARVHALWSLQGLKSLTDADLLAALADPSPRVVEQAVKLAESRLDGAPELLDVVLGLARSDDARVRFFVALALGATADPRAADALAVIARRDGGEHWTRLAVLASASAVADRLFAALAADRDFSSRDDGRAVLVSLAEVVGARNRPGEVARALDAIGASDPAAARRLVVALGRGMARSGGRLDAGSPTVAAILRRAESEARAESVPEATRAEAVAALGLGPYSRARDTLADLLDAGTPGGVQAATLRALAGYPEPEVAGLVLTRLRQFTPVARAEAIATLLAREPWTLALLKATKAGTADPAGIDPTRRALLLAHRNPEIAALAKSLLGDPAVSPARDLLAAFVPALAQPSDPARGSAVFERLCQSCHRVGDRGHAVGPDLTATQFAEPEALLSHILDPNRYVAPNHVQYVVGDRTGRVYTGLIASETASSLTLRRADGVEDTILRGQIDEMVSTGKSLMPDDFASQLTPAEASDLVAFLLKSRTTALAPAARLEIGTLPGLIEPEGQKP